MKWTAGWANSEGIFDLDTKTSRLATLESSMAAPGFWDNPERARSIVEEMQRTKRWTEPFAQLSQRTRDSIELASLLESDPDPEVERGLTDELAEIRRGLADLELQTMLQGPDDRRGAILTIHPGAGGTESQDWAEMLLRMYTRWAERKGYKVEILDLLQGEEAGIKSVTVQIEGEYAYGFLKAEKGVHRLVRISPFDSQARRHTSFASVFVYPLVDDTIEIDLRDEDIEMDVYRASGAGGQHVNKT